MLFTPDIDIFGEKLEMYRNCFSRPQWRHFKTYMNGLVVGEKGEKNIQDIISNTLDGRSQSSLNRFLTKPRWNVRRLNNLRLKENLEGIEEGGVLILDDSFIEKTGKSMDGVGYLYDHSKKKSILCHDIVSTLYINGNRRVPLYFNPYLKKEVAEELDIWFKTRIEIAIELLKKSFLWVKPRVVVFDEWYMSKELLEFLNSYRVTWVSMAKSNRLVLQGNGTWVNLREYARGIPKSCFKRIDKELEERRYRWLYETKVVMKNVGEIKLVILKERINSRNCKFIVSNDISMEGLKVFEYYKKRWSIEVFYRDCKQYLGMGDYQVRKLDAVVIHLHLVFLAYTLLKNNCFNPIVKEILHGIEAIGSICSRLKRWVFKQLLKIFRKNPSALPV